MEYSSFSTHTKKGDLRVFDNYRGIALIDTLCKILMKVVNEKMLHIDEKNKILAAEQAGFRRNEECIAQATLLYETLRRRNIFKKVTYICFLDFKKAYDKVPHNGLIEKLTKMGIGVKIISLIKAIYNNPKIKIRVNVELSGSYSYKRGLRQGYPLSPLLFNLHINDIFENIEGINTYMENKKTSGLLFADDTVVLANSPEMLAENINKIKRL